MKDVKAYGLLEVDSIDGRLRDEGCDVECVCVFRFEGWISRVGAQGG